MSESGFRKTEIENIRNELRELFAQLKGEREAGAPKEDTLAEEAIDPNAEFNAVVENPASVKPNHTYSVETRHSGTVKVLFSRKLVSDIFLSRDDAMIQMVSGALKEVEKGLFGSGYQGTGIVKLAGQKDIVEIRKVGNGIGLRIFGYIHSGKVHFVAFGNRTDHTQSFTTKGINATKAARFKRGH